MTVVNPNVSEIKRSIREALQAHWRLFLLQGVIMILLGGLAVAAPALATIAVDIYVGWLFLISGTIGFVAMFSARDISGFFWTFATALLSVVVGALLIWTPVEGALSLTIVLTAFFIMEGVLQAAASLVYRRTVPESWGWMFASGLADLALAAIIIAGWPGSAAWTLGLIVGINLVTSGWAIVMMALAARSVDQISTASAAKR
jgi:uncharacterized membrane protein HdeD (DUF308 family)